VSDVANANQSANGIGIAQASGTNAKAEVHIHLNAPGQAEQLCQGKEMENPEYSKVLGDAIKLAKNPTALMGSVGEAEFARSFITRLFDEPVSRGLPKPSISRVMLKRLSNELVETKTKEKTLDPEFGATLTGNLGYIKNTLDRYSIELQVLDWKCFTPPFHGWIFGDHVFRNSWELSPSGVFWVRTVLRYYTKAGTPKMWQDSVDAFEGHG